MTTAEQAVAQVRHNLLGGMREQVNWLNGSISASATTLTLTDSVDGIKPTMTLEIDRETMYVRTVTSGSLQCTVKRGWDDTTAGTHADDAPVYVDRFYPTDLLFAKIKEEILSLNGTGLCYYDAADITFASTSTSYDLIDLGVDDDLIDIYSVTYESDTAGESRHRPVRFRLHRDRDLTDFPSGLALEIIAGGSHNYPLRVTYKRAFTAPDDLSDDLDVPDYVTPAVVAGATWRALLGMEARRTNPRAEHGSRRAEEVPVQSNAFAARAFQSMREDMIARAREIQMQRYPIRQVD